MWREDDFDDHSKDIKIVPRDWAEELINHPDLEPEAKVERADGSAQQLSDCIRN